MSDRQDPNEVAQGVAAVAGVTFGLIPLVRVVFGGEVGLWLSWLPGTEDDPGRWIAPIVLTVLMLVIVLVLEQRKHRG